VASNTLDRRRRRRDPRPGIPDHRSDHVLGPSGNRWTVSVAADTVAVVQKEPWEQEQIWDAETAQRYDTPGAGMFAPQVLGPTVERLAEFAAGGRALEFAIGTGRVAVPLAEAGVPVAGIELSPAMVDQLRTKADAATIPVVVGDMATALVPGEFSRLPGL